MVPTVDGVFRCTFKDCDLSFDTERSMRRHKKFSEKHDYCGLCDQDFESYDDLAQHKIFRPDKHHLACRICGEEFKSKDGLKLHVETRHGIEQRLPCLGCGAVFHRASLMVEHLEFGHCRVVSPEQFMGHIVHKHLVTELLRGGPEYERFQQKMAKFNAAQDFEAGGGVELPKTESRLLDDDDDDETATVGYEPIKAEFDGKNQVTHPGQYPPLRSAASGMSDIISNVGRMSVAGPESEVEDDSTTSGRKLKPWAGRSSKKLFPDAKPTPVMSTSEFSIEQHDAQMAAEGDINILNTRFWDPLSRDFKAERFYDGVAEAYFCPFPCEQTFQHPKVLHDHILDMHRIMRMKCPRCLKCFKTVTALIAHCESRGSRCNINRADDFGIFLDKLTGGFLGVREEIRPDHVHNPAILVKDASTGRMAAYEPPTVTYLEYSVTKPADWREPVRTTQIGGSDQGLIGYHGRRTW